jgi:hypothetical protein
VDLSYSFRELLDEYFYTWFIDQKVHLQRDRIAYGIPQYVSYAKALVYIVRRLYSLLTSNSRDSWQVFSEGGEAPILHG